MNDSKVEILFYLFSHIDVNVKGDRLEKDWRFTDFYGHFDTNRKQEFWQLLRSLRDQISLSWLCAGDFNEIMDDGEKKRRVLRLVIQIEDFHEVINECRFMELPYSGPRITWTRKFWSEIIEERLDKGLANKEWLDRFPLLREDHIVVASSDHLMLLFNVISQQRRRWSNIRRFRFENM